MPVLVKTSDDEAFELADDVANLSVTIRNMIDDLGDISSHGGPPIPLSNVSSVTLRRVLAWGEYYKTMPEARDAEESAELRPFDRDLLSSLDMKSVFDLIMAANFLDIKRLLDTACKEVALRIKGKDVTEILALFDIHDEITEEERLQVMRENPWLMDGCEDIPELQRLKDVIIAESESRLTTASTVSSP